MDSIDKRLLVEMVLSELNKRIREAEEQLFEILRRANEAPGAMQSHSDTDKNLYGRQAAGQKESVDILKQERVALGAVLFGATPAISIGSLVETRDGSEALWYFILPGGSGITIKGSVGDITVVAPHTPLGSVLVGKKPGETIGVGKRILTIVGVH